MINRFKRARLIAGLTQTELAEKLGVSTNSIHKWETGESMPKVKRLNAVACALQTTVEYLLDEEGRAV